MANAKKWNVAVVGATGAVGGEMAKILEERNFPVQSFYPLASSRSVGRKVEFGGDEISVGDLSAFDFARAQIALFSAGGEVAAEFAPLAAKAGCVVVDNSSQFRRDENVPLVVAEINPQSLANYKNRGIVANPNCSTMQMTLALYPLHRVAKIVRINAATYQAVSGAGARAVDELAKQSAALLEGREEQKEIFPARIAFNAIPHIDRFMENGYTREEMKMVWETRRIFSDETIEVNPTAVRVPVFYGHSIAAHIETRDKLSAEDARQLLSDAPGIRVIDERKEGGYPTPSEHAAGADDVFVGRIREDISHPRGLNLWIVGDNVRKGGALNAVQLAEILAAEYL